MLLEFWIGDQDSLKREKCPCHESLLTAGLQYPAIRSAIGPPYDFGCWYGVGCADLNPPNKLSLAGLCACMRSVCLPQESAPHAALCRMTGA